ncbi:hypothetical protein BZA77DRAFT_303410 [Pyronema omphalodes]|nr:hypothetical protein BZA77DRAFT_303410 [Pyronema omphalodes]
MGSSFFILLSLFFFFLDFSSSSSSLLLRWLRWPLWLLIFFYLASYYSFLVLLSS